MDWLRGLAALTVALYHFTGGLDRWIKASGARGYLGSGDLQFLGHFDQALAAAPVEMRTT